MDDALTGHHLERIFGHSSFEKRLLVWDSFRCHMSKATKERLKEQSLDTAVIPGGCTKFVQAPASGNSRAPAMDVYLDWICQSWDAIPNEMTVKSFKDCGITNCHDGSEADLIHCFKVHGSVPEGRSMPREMLETILRNAA